MPRTTLDIERKRLETLQNSTLIGISYIGADGKLATEFDDDPGLREAIIEYQTQCVRELELSERTLGGMVQYQTPH